MASFVVIRHPELGLGTCPTDATELFRASGWVVVSSERPEPSYFNLPDFADAPAIEQPESPAEPEQDEE